MANDDNAKKPWVPETPEDWADVFCSGMKKYDAERAEWEAKVAAQNGGNTGEGGTNGGNGNGTADADKQPVSWRERLLG